GVVAAVVGLTSGTAPVEVANGAGAAHDWNAAPLVHNAAAGRRDDPAAPQGSGSDRPSGFGRVGESWNVFVLDLSDRERSEVQVQIDGQAYPVPPLGPVSFALAAGDHTAQLTRPGFDSIDYAFRLGDNALESYRPRWQMAGGAIGSLPPAATTVGSGHLGMDDWQQDLALAKALAAREGKDLFIAFNGSDWCGWCVRLINEVLTQPEFRREIEEDFVLVSIDSPRGRDAARRVQDMARNERMVEQYGVSGFPTIILADSAGQPYATGGFVAGGVGPFLASVQQMRSERSRRDALFAAVQSSTGKARIAAGEKALEWLKDQGALLLYAPTLRGWLDLARRDDPRNEAGELEVFFEMHWMAGIASVDRADLGKLRPLTKQLSDFNRDCKFRDADRGGRLNFVAAAFLSLHEEFDSALQFAEAGLSCRPDDAELVAKLQRVKMALQNSDVIGSGTGFLIAEGGYILTNFHVIEEGTPYVRVPGEKEPVRANVIAKDQRNDIALLRLQDPRVAPPQLVAISTAAVGRGAPVGVFGYPLSDAVGAGIKLTTGVVSALPDSANEGMLLLDCRVNPGNSGGPLCDSSGQVIGMVTAKSDVGFGVDSYGMAQPAAKLQAFLSAHLPEVKINSSPPDRRMQWDEVDRQVSGAVLMIVMKKE
ncbi:MAG: trypsin-like peptidase domain-containing protein, partial [Planctomycetales bacterium]|nr:trypsin-like peptidase domain-containing protein [Planctomycetales bacterium]